MGCAFEPIEFCGWDESCNGDGDGCPVCDNVVCDDGNECTEDFCNCETGECGVGDGLDGFVCDLDGSTGVCLHRVCQEDVWCNGTCDDGNECTVHVCRFDEGVCDKLTPGIGDGTVCSGGFCRDEVCVTLLDQCTADDLGAIESGDEPDAEDLAACRQDWNAFGGGEEELWCITAITNCIQGSGTSLSAECSSCFALRECCMWHECGCESPEPRCDDCVQESCQPLADACVGGQ
jgi:hypothetical protein